MRFMLLALLAACALDAAPKEVEVDACTPAEETCNDVDDDCDGDIDEEPNGGPWWRDFDGDGHGDHYQPFTRVCDPGDGWVDNDDDCDDRDPWRYPDAWEYCDGEDQDCDGEVDEGLEEPRWQDADGDGYGDPESPANTCDDTGWVENDDDCDDRDPSQAIATAEVCDDRDNDCDGLVDGRDPSLSDGTTWYADDDGDGFGDPLEAEISCSAPPGYVADGSDCDDGAYWVHPGANESCDGDDDDCDGTNDDGACRGSVRRRIGR